MSTLTAADFASVIEEYWHGRSPSSLEDVMTLYGVLATAESDGELFRTSSKLDPFVDDGRLVTIHVDLTTTPPEYRTTTVDRLRSDHVPQLGYAAKTSGRGADYSITQSGSKSGNAPETLADTHLGRIRLWCGYDSVRDVTGDAGHPDGWVVDALGQVFEKDSDTMEQIADDIEALLSGDEPTVITVAVDIDTADLEHEDDRGIVTFYPGELDVLEAAMRRYNAANDANKNIKPRTSEGQAVGLVTGAEGRVVGTPESPLDTFSIKHPDVQPGLRRTASWRNYPVNEQTAQLIAKGAELIERCVLREGGMETYALPYFAGELTPAKAETLYNAIQSLDPDSDDSRPPMARVTYDIAESDDEAVQALADELRFYYITLPIGDDTHVIAETPAATTYWVNQVAAALVETLGGPTTTPRAGGFGHSTNWTLLDPPADIDIARRWAFARIVGHDFINATFGYRDEAEDDFRRVVNQRLIEGQPIAAGILFEEYVRRLGDEFDNGGVPWQIAATQFIQLEALSRAGLLGGFDSAVEPQHTVMTSDQIEATDLDTIREQRLESFLDRPMFAGDGSESGPERPGERQAAFLSGVLIGQISWHQENERSIGRPLDTRTQADKLTARTLEQTLQSALDNARIYAGESDYGNNVLYPEVVDRLLEAMATQPTDWTLEKRELQFLVALGQSYGRRAMPVAFDVRERNSSTETDAAPTEQEA